MNRVKRQCVMAAVSGLLLGPSTLHAEQPKPTEYQVQAAYLYNFGKFVQWPAGTTGSGAFTVCVLGDNPIEPVLDATVAGGTVRGKAVVARQIAAASEALNCQILFISSSQDGALHKIQEALSKAAVLTVSDMPRFTERGGMIQFILEGHRVRFRVNLTAAQNVGLVLSSQLLKLAEAVRTDPVSGE